MTDLRRVSARILACSALMSLIGLLGTGPLAQLTGEEFSRCVQQCNEIRRMCDDRCADECRAMFPDDKSARDSCIAACKAICSSESDECKEVCLIQKNESPTDP